MKANHLWPELFGNDRPVEIEIGCGTGTFLLQIAADHPERNFFGIEHARPYAAKVERLIETRGTTNVRIIAADAACLLRHVLPPASVSAFHIYFPDPWWKRRHHRRRLFNEGFVLDLARVLLPAGYVHTATDVEQTFALIRQSMRAAFVEDQEVRPPRRNPTSFERKGVARGAAIWEMSFRRR